MSIAKPRSKDTRWVEPDEMLIGEFEHEWLRCAAYSDGHVLSQDGKTALCGAPLYVTPHEWDSLRAHLQARTGVDIDEWWIAVDTRKGGKCSKCKKFLKDGRDPFEPSEQKESYEQAMAEPEPSPSLSELSPSERLQRAKRDAAVSRIARAFNAEVVSAA